MCFTLKVDSSKIAAKTRLEYVTRQVGFLVNWILSTFYIKFSNCNGEKQSFFLLNSVFFSDRRVLLGVRIDGKLRIHTGTK